MSTSTRLPATLAMVVVAFLVALAPLFHAVCIAPLATGAVSASVSHVMADGTVMAMGSAAADAASADATAASDEPADGAAPVDAATPDGGTQRPAIGAVTGDPLSLAGVLGTVLLVAGIALSAILGLRVFSTLARVLGRPSVRAVRVEPPRFALARAPASVDLVALSISRT